MSFEYSSVCKCLQAFLLCVLHIPQTPNTRGLTLIGVLISLAMFCFVIGDCKGGMQWLLEQGLLSCNALSILAAVYCTCSLQFITNKIIGTQGQNSRVLMSSFGVVFSSLRHVYTVKSEYKQWNTIGGFIKDEYCSWVQYKSGPGGRPSM